MSNTRQGSRPRHGSQGEPARKQRWPVVAVAVVLVLALGIWTFTGNGGDGRSAGPKAPELEDLTPSSQARTPVTTSMGVYSQGDPAKVAQFEQWSSTKVQYVVDFTQRKTWEDIADPDYFLNVWEGSDYRLVWGIAMLPTGDKAANIGAGAEGRYDHFYTELAEHLVEHGQGHAVLRLGWEFNLNISRWRTSDPQQYVQYYQRIVKAMRAVDGAKFSFDWNFNNGDNSYDAALYYPGDAYVDVIGVDVYDVSSKSGTYPYPANCDDYCRTDRQTRAWDTSIYGGDRGLKYWSAFAAAHGKAMSIPEWGLWDESSGISGGDDPAFIERMYDFITDPKNNVAYQSYFEFDNDQVKHSLQQTFPIGGARYQQLFGGK